MNTHRTLFIGLTLTLLISACKPQPSSPPVVQASAPPLEQAPSFTLETLAGETLSLEDYRGQTVVIHFGTSWCPFCRAEDPHLEALYQAYKERGVQVLVINVEEDDVDATEWKEEASFYFPMLMDRDGAVAARYAPPDAQPDLPRPEVMVAANLVIDRMGQVRFMSLLDTQTFDAKLVALRARLDEVLAEDVDA